MYCLRGEHILNLKYVLSELFLILNAYFKISNVFLQIFNVFNSVILITKRSLLQKLMYIFTLLIDVITLKMTTKIRWSLFGGVPI